ncbi:MAG: FliH/SctL family protein [Planctomycetota bacterium]
MATVIRNAQAIAGGAHSVLPADFTLSDMAAQGEAYVRTVRTEASREVQEAKAQADEIRRKAEANGLADAAAKLDERIATRLADELATLRPALESMTAQLDAARDEWLAHWRGGAIGLAVKIAERIARRELAADPSIGESWLAEALELAAGSSRVTVRLAPADFEHLRGYGETLLGSFSKTTEVRFEADTAITPGGCRVETTHGSIDQQLEAQLERLAEELA